MGVPQVRQRLRAVRQRVLAVRAQDRDGQQDHDHMNLKALANMADAWAEHEVTRVTPTKDARSRAAIKDIAVRAFIKGYAAGWNDRVVTTTKARAPLEFEDPE